MNPTTNTPAMNVAIREKEKRVVISESQVPSYTRFSSKNPKMHLVDAAMIRDNIVHLIN